MKIRLWIVLAVAALGLVPASAVPSVPAFAGVAPGDLAAALARAVADGYPGMVAYARRDGRELRLAAGVADQATGRPARPGDRFRIASNTKAFVATVVLQLAGEHRLRLDDPVARWLPWARTTATVRQLLDHTSGIWDPTTEAGFWAPYLERHDMDFVYHPRDLVLAAASAPSCTTG